MVMTFTPSAFAASTCESPSRAHKRIALLQREFSSSISESRIFFHLAVLATLLGIATKIGKTEHDRIVILVTDILQREKNPLFRFPTHSRPAFNTITPSQAPIRDSPRNCCRCWNAFKRASCTRSSASSLAVCKVLCQQCTSISI